MQLMIPRDQQRLLVDDIDEVMDVTLYSNSWRTRVAEGRIIRRTPNSRYNVDVGIDLDDNGKVHAPGTIVDIIEGEPPEMRRTTLESLFRRADEEGPRKVSVSLCLSFDMYCD